MLAIIDNIYQQKDIQRTWNDINLVDTNICTFLKLGNVRIIT